MLSSEYWPPWVYTGMSTPSRYGVSHFQIWQTLYQSRIYGHILPSQGTEQQGRHGRVRRRGKEKGGFELSQRRGELHRMSVVDTHLSIQHYTVHYTTQVHHLQHTPVRASAYTLTLLQHAPEIVLEIRLFSIWNLYSPKATGSPSLLYLNFSFLHTLWWLSQAMGIQLSSLDITTVGIVGGSSHCLRIMHIASFIYNHMTMNVYNVWPGLRTSHACRLLSKLQSST